MDAAHASTQVRAVAGLGSDLICSGSRDTTLRTWKRVSPSKFEQDATLPVHHDYVNAVATIGPTADFPEGANGQLASFSRNLPF
jgi:hypothetical protein